MARLRTGTILDILGLAAGLIPLAIKAWGLAADAIAERKRRNAAERAAKLAAENTQIVARPSYYNDGPPAPDDFDLDDALQRAEIERRMRGGAPAPEPPANDGSSSLRNL